MNIQDAKPAVLEAAVTLLSKLARDEEDTAADEAAKVPYWGTWPTSVTEHRAAARALRAEVERLQRLATAAAIGSSHSPD